MASYGALATTQPEEEQQQQQQSPCQSGWRHRLGLHLESNRTHITVLTLTVIDTACVMLQICYTFFHECQVPAAIFASKTPETWIVAFEMAELLSITINMVFLLECFLCLVAFGKSYYLPGNEHWMFHVFDVSVVVTTFILDIFLRGKEREVAGLLIILRLWRVIKIIEGVVVGVSYTHQEELESLQEKLEQAQSKAEQLEKELATERQRVSDLQQQLT